MKFKLSPKVKSVIVFEIKLIAFVVLIGVLEFWIVNSMIAKGSEIVANAYTQDLK